MNTLFLTCCVSDFFFASYMNDDSNVLHGFSHNEDFVYGPFDLRMVGGVEALTIVTFSFGY